MIAARATNETQADQIAGLYKEREVDRTALSDNQDTIQRVELELRLCIQAKTREIASQQREIVSRDDTIAGLKRAFELESQSREQAEVQLHQAQTSSVEGRCAHP